MTSNLHWFREMGALKAMQFELFKPYEQVMRYGCFTRHGGVSQSPFHSLNTVFATKDVQNHVTANQQLVRDALGFPDASLVVPSFAHGNKVVTIQGREQVNSSFTTLPDTDAVITAERGVILFLSTADCSPIFFYEKKFGIIGIAHAGWRGVVSNIAGEVIRAILKLAPTSPENILVAVGASIGPCCYRMLDPDQAKLPGWKSYLSSCEGGLTAVNLWQALEGQLIESGILQENIFNSRHCTACDTENFFSHWSEKPRTGRFPSAIVKL